MNPARTRLVLALLLGLAAFVLYARSLGSGFVYDAEIQIQHDSYIHTPANFADVATFRVLGQDVLDGTRPVHLLSLMLDSLVWGRHAFGYHLTSNLLHALNAALVFLLLTRLGASSASPRRVMAAALVGTLLFITHPVLVEAVSEVSDREDLLALFFTLLALLVATHFPGASRGFLRGAACTFLILLAAGSKETGFVAPLVLGIYAVAFRGMKPRRAWTALLAACFIVTGLFIAARFGLPPEDSRIFTARPGYIGGSFAEMLAIQPRIWVFLLANTAWPLHLSADYQPQNVAWISLTAALPVLALVVAVQLLLSFRSRLALLGTAIFWLGLAPVSNFIPIFRPIGDRFLYMPMAGLAAMVCAALLLARGRRSFCAFCALGLAAALGCIPLAWGRQKAFANPLELWTDTLEKSPTSQTAANNLGYALVKAGRHEDALQSFARALQLTQEKHADAWAGAAITLQKMGRTADARVALRRAIALDPRYAAPRELMAALVTDSETAAMMEEILAAMPPES